MEYASVFNDSDYPAAHIKNVTDNFKLLIRSVMLGTYFCLIHDGIGIIDQILQDKFPVRFQQETGLIAVDELLKLSQAFIVREWLPSARSVKIIDNFPFHVVVEIVFKIIVQDK